MNTIYFVKSDKRRESEKTYLTGKKRKQVKMNIKLMNKPKVPEQPDYVDGWRKRMRKFN